MAKRKLPATVAICGEKHAATVLQVVESDEDGTPRVLRLLRDDERVNLQGGEQFWVVYAPAAMTKRRD